MYTAVFKMDNRQDPTYCVAQGTLFKCYMAAWMGGEIGGEWIQVYVWPCPFTIQLKLSNHC